MTEHLPDADDVVERIAAYLAGGGLFNPELANHGAVSKLLIDARNELKALRMRCDRQAKIIAKDDTTESYRCTECGAWHLRPPSSAK